MIDFDWDTVEFVARETGKSILLGRWEDFTIADKREMSKEARARHMCITMGNHKRNSDEEDDEVYVTAKL